MRNKNYCLFSVFLVLSVLTLTAMAQNPPEWAKREYSAPPDKVFAAALLSIQAQKHEIKWKDDSLRVVEFHVGTTAWSWGYNMRLMVKPIDDKRTGVECSVSKSGGKVFSWGSGSKEVKKILAGIDAELAAAKSGLN